MVDKSDASCDTLNLGKEKSIMKNLEPDGK